MRDAEANPWTTLSTRRVYENPWITVREDQVIRPDGAPGIYGVVESKVATGVVALTAADEVVLVGQWRYPTRVYSWEIIEGGADPGEAPIEGARRELREEAGLEAETWTPLLGELHLSNCFTAERGFLWLARGLREVGAAPEPTEVLQVRRVPFAECLARVLRGEVQDAMTVMGLLAADRLLQAERGREAPVMR